MRFNYSQLNSIIFFSSGKSVDQGIRLAAIFSSLRERALTAVFFVFLQLDLLKISDS